MIESSDVENETRDSIINDVQAHESVTLFEITKQTWDLGLITFGGACLFLFVLQHTELICCQQKGPTANVALFQERFVKKLKWVDDETFLELFGLCGAIPG